MGLGGTGSYLLDLLAKTPAGEIHLFDGDHLLNHNAFRAPGAIALDDLRQRPSKVAYFQKVYNRLHRHIISHEYALGKHNATELDEMSFVFICMDSGPAKQALVGHLESRRTTFIDVGMGLDELEGSIGGMLRVTLSTPDMRQHVWDNHRITFDDPDDEANQYARNIQVADLNSLNACLAMIRYKRYLGFYRDLEYEHNSLYTIDGNHLLNERLIPYSAHRGTHPRSTAATRKEQNLTHCADRVQREHLAGSTLDLPFRPLWRSRASSGCVSQLDRRLETTFGAPS